jgi:sigma-B regulation protein RsbU (phosphoserine phosphatase)
MASSSEPILHEQLIDRRRRLEAALSVSQETTSLRSLLFRVDSALKRMEQGSYGLCEICSDPIEPGRLIADPLTTLCLDHLTPTQQHELEEDLELASQTQKGLLPKQDFKVKGWEVSYHYEPAGLVSGDYCDLVSAADGGLYFMMGDVSGKGVAASMLMAHLHAMLRTLISVDLPLHDIVQRASRMFCESTLPTHFATLVCGWASSSGEVELCNAGHPPAILLGSGEVKKIGATGLPVGLFCDQKFSVEKAHLGLGDSLILYTDGLSEAKDRSGQEYGVDRLVRLAQGHRDDMLIRLIDVCVKDLTAFRDDAARVDDLTMMVIRRVE